MLVNAVPMVWCGTIVTPATKHLRKEIARIEAGATACALEM